MKCQKHLNVLNILYYYVQQCIASSNNNNLDTISHPSTKIVLNIYLDMKDFEP